MNYMPRLLNAKCAAKTVDEFIIFENITQTLATRASFYIMQTKKLMEDPEFTVKQKNNERYAINVQRMIKAHMQLVCFLMAKEYIQKHKFNDKAIAPILLLCVKIFGLKQLQHDTQGLYECGYFSAGSEQLLQDAMHKLLTELRPHMIPLTESYGLDSQDHNVIGNKWGDIYELQLDTARKTRLNR